MNMFVGYMDGVAPERTNTGISRTEEGGTGQGPLHAGAAPVFSEC